MNNSNNKHPIGWNKYTAQENYQIGVTKDTCYSGKYCAFIKSVEAEPEGKAVLSQSLDAAQYQGKRLRFSAFIKSTKLSQVGSLEVMNYADDHTTVGGQFCQINEDSDWSRYEIVYDVPLGAVLIVCSINMEGTGTIWVDDVRFDVAETDTETTPLPVIPKPTNASPTNLDFEGGMQLYSDKNGKEWEVPSGWSMSSSLNAKSNIELIKSSDESTPNMVSIQTEEGKVSSCEFVQFVEASCFKGKEVGFSALTKTENIDFCTLIMTAFASNNRPIRFGLSDPIKPMKATSNWDSFECDLPIDSKAEYFSFGLLTTGSGQVWLKEIKISDEPYDKSEDEEVDPEVALQNPKPTNLELKPPTDEKISSRDEIIPAGWIARSDKQHCVELDPKESLDESPCVLIKSIVDEPTEYACGTLKQHVAPQKFLGKRLRFSAHIKTVEADWVAVWLRARREGRYVYTIGFKSLHKDPIVGTTDWSEHDCVVDVPSDCINIKFGVVLSGRGKCWISKTSLEEVSLDVPTNDVKVVAPRKKVLENPDFEKY